MTRSSLPFSFISLTHTPRNKNKQKQKNKKNKTKQNKDKTNTIWLLCFLSFLVTADLDTASCNSTCVALIFVMILLVALLTAGGVIFYRVKKVRIYFILDVFMGFGCCDQC